MLFERIPEGDMRASLWDIVQTAETEQDLVIKEIYLALGRPCELVFTSSVGGNTHIMRSDGACAEEHISAFLPLFRHLPAELRRTVRARVGAGGVGSCVDGWMGVWVDGF